MTSAYEYADWGESGYVPPNRDLPQHRSAIVDGLPVPAYEEAAYVPGVDWASVLIELAVDHYGGENSGYYEPERCTCGVSWVGDAPCWFCHPQPPPKLILPLSASDRRWGLP